MKKTFLVIFVAFAAAGQAQQSDIILKLTGGTKRVIAIPDFRGAGPAQKFADVFNQTVFDDVQQSGLLQMAAKSFYPLNPPQQAADMVAAPSPGQTSCGGRCPVDWSGPPVNANYLAFGYVAAQNDQFVAFGHLYNVNAELAGAQIIRKLYLGTMDEAGARKTGHEFAADILAQFGAKPLAGSKVYFVSDRGGAGTKDLWSMDFDGSSPKALTSYKSISITPAVSVDGTRLAFTTFAKGEPRIYIHSLETNRFLPFLNPRASMNATPEFTPDAKQLLFSSTLSGYAQVYIANIDGGDMRRLSTSRAIEVEPKVNPKTGAEIVFVSGRSGPQQIYKMNMDGADVVRLTSGEGEASNPAWHPDGQHIAFAWTRGYAPGNWNIFIMDVASRETVQLTYGAGRNENPSWAPDGRHLVFSSSRSGKSQIFTMLADGQELKQLTTQGSNWMPVWGK
jgi:TolB protein